MNPPPTDTADEPAPYASHERSHVLPDHGESHYHAAQAAATASAALSSNHTPTPNAVANGRKRRATGAPGSRGVANLTPEQLAKKRANDREAQRAIRERTRNTIESLERRIRELESQQPFQDLQRVVQERDRALADCEELRRRLGAVAGIVGGTQHPNLNGMFTFDQLIDSTLLTDTDAELAALTAQQSPLPPLTRGASHSDTPSGQGQSYEQQQQTELHPDLRLLHASQSPVTQDGTVHSASMYRQGQHTLRKWSPSLGYTPKQQQQYTTNGVYHEQQRASPPQMQQHGNGDRLGVNFLLDSKSASTSPTEPSFPSPNSADEPAWARLPMTAPASCPLDSLFIEFISSRRKMLQTGTPVEEVIGPKYPAFAALIDSESCHPPRCHPLSALLIEILSKFPDVSELPEKAAAFYIMFLILRWQICPTQEHYERMPECCRPTTTQLENPHVCWADFLPFPHMRNQLALNDIDVKIDDFFVPYTRTLSVNWPLPHDCILLRASESGTDHSTSLEMNPAFEYHALNIDNWSLGQVFRDTFPHLIDERIKIKDR